MSKQEQKGGCLCGGVKFRLAEVPREVGVCHCGMCRRQNGGLPAAGAAIAPPAFDAAGPLKWRRSSAWGERGFCSDCGTNLFWRPADGSAGWVALVGALDRPPPLKIARHIFVDERPDFYDFVDAAPRLTGAEWFQQVVEMLRATRGDAVADQALEMAKAAQAGK